ncbi:hypothetical protein ACVWWW_001803 [Lysobacter sp. HA18]
MDWQSVLAGRRACPLLGAELDPFPYISGYGCALRTTRLGVLTSQEITAMGLRGSSRLDVLVATQQRRSAKLRMLRALGLGATAVGALWSTEAWSPAQLGGKLDAAARPLRQCPGCAQYGYHSALFQLPTVTYCPWHRDRLTDACPSCGNATWARFDQLHRLARCACGHDPFDARQASTFMWDFPTTAADRWCSQYLEWARVERERRWILLPDLQHAWSEGLSSLAPLPKVLEPAAASRNTETFHGEGPDGRREDFWGWTQLGSDRPLTFVPLRGQLKGLLETATLGAVAALPEDFDTPAELVHGRGFEPDCALGANIENRADCLFEPFVGRDDGSVWLNLSAVDPATPLYCGQLIELVTRALAPEPADPFEDRSAHVLRAEALASVQGSRHLLHALEALLTQGFRQGLEAVLLAMARASAAVEASRWLAPVVEIQGERGALFQLSLTWVLVPPPKLRRTVDVPVATRASSKQRSVSSRRLGRARRRQGAAPRRRSRAGALCRPTR